MIDVLHAAWLVTDEGLSRDDVVDEYLRLVADVEGVSSSAVYSVLGGGEKMNEVAATLARLDFSRLRSHRPVAVALSSLSSLKGLPELAKLFGTTGEVDPAIEASRYVAAQAVYKLAGAVDGPSAANAPAWAPAVQFGALNTESVASEWLLSDWYENVRFPECQLTGGAYRASRYVSICGPTKFAVLYEFESLAARLAHFEGHEARGLDREHPSSRVRDVVVHLPGAPYIGELLRQK